MNQTTTQFKNRSEGTSVLASLRRLIPERQLARGEVLQLAELQANRLREITGADSSSLDAAIAGLPRVRVIYRELPTSGLSFWDGTHWIVQLNDSEPATRQRFTLLHEYKHILDHGAADRMFADGRGRTAQQQAEQVADYFAGCALMPKRLLKQAWGRGVQRITDLASLFAVSPRAIEVRLAQIGLSESPPRCGSPLRQPTSLRRGSYYRQATRTWSSSGAAA